MRTALVLGGGNTVWDDVEAALNLGRFDVVVACNDVGAEWPGRLDAWASLHAESFGMWTTRRVQRGHPQAGRVFAHNRPRQAPIRGVTDFTEFRLPGQVETGSSGLFALKVALIDMGADRAVLCGIPMTPVAAHFFDTKPWRDASAHVTGWRQAQPVIKDRTRSMSGWTADLLGLPDKEWLGQGPV